MKVDEFKIITEDLKRRKIPAELKKAVSAMLDKKAEKVVVLKLKGSMISPTLWRFVTAIPRGRTPLSRMKCKRN